MLLLFSPIEISPGSRNGHSSCSAFTKRTGLGVLPLKRCMLAILPVGAVKTETDYCEIYGAILSALSGDVGRTEVANGRCPALHQQGGSVEGVTRGLVTEVVCTNR